jgi:hypothetical protein
MKERKNKENNKEKKKKSWSEYIATRGRSRPTIQYQGTTYVDSFKDHGCGNGIEFAGIYRNLRIMGDESSNLTHMETLQASAVPSYDGNVQAFLELLGLWKGYKHL